MKNGKIKFDWPLVGNSHISDFLEKCLVNKSISGTYIFTGPDNLGKTTLAKNFAKILLCREREREGALLPCGHCDSCRQFKDLKNERTDTGVQAEIGEGHGDFHIIKPDKDKKNISIEQTRDFINALSMSSFMGGHKIGIIKHADALSTGAANALLKTLEEPRKDVVIIMIAEDADSLPATIASRSRILHFKPVKSELIYDYLIEEHKAGREEAKEMAQLCLGRPALALKFLEDKEALDFYRKQVNVFLDFEQQSIGERFNAIAELFGKKPESREAVRIAKRILQAWQGALRDWLLLEHGYNNLIQHQIEAEKIKAMARRIKPAGIICLYQALKRAEANIEANVNPKLALEEVAVMV